MKDKCAGYFTNLNGKTFYKIENFDLMEDFFMTVTSSSDVWNFLWSKGGITAGRADCDHSIFPYYTADKVSDMKYTTGSYSAVRIIKNGKTYQTEPFAALKASALAAAGEDGGIRHNLYKNISGTEIWFEEINPALEIAFRTGWTSSAKYGIVRRVEIENLSPHKITAQVLDGCRNIMSACCTADFQNGNSVLLDAYKKTDLDGDANLALFSLSSVVTDKAEPNESLLANTCWFTTEDALILNPAAPLLFASGGKIGETKVLKGKRASCFISRTVALSGSGSAGAKENWCQVFDTALTHTRIAELKAQIADRSAAKESLLRDVSAGIALMDQYVGESDGIQQTADQTASAHHYANVMFNIMRGGIFAEYDKLPAGDFLSFVKSRNVREYEKLRPVLESLPGDENGRIEKDTLKKALLGANNPQAMRLFLEYMPLTFSRRHGDPSRPWNRFHIRLRDENGRPILSYEGNWRDIFQNWEALAFSYPEYVPNMCAKFLNAMTAEGFNPYRISRDGIDWEIPDPENPWAQIGYWGDHQVIYLEKLLELWRKIDGDGLRSMLDKEYFSTSRIPYAIRPFAEIRKDPRHTIIFDGALNAELQKKAEEEGSDGKLIRTKSGDVALFSMTAKLLQIVICKAANFIPGGGIWLNTQRPEWNDANNALAGYGLSMVTVCYFSRYLRFLDGLYSDSAGQAFPVPEETGRAFSELAELYRNCDCEKTAQDSVLRSEFAQNAGLIFQTENDAVRENGYSGKTVRITGKDIVSAVRVILRHIDFTIKNARRADGLYHSYNTLVIGDGSMEIENLQEMLEGQVAVLSAGTLSGGEALTLLQALKTSRLFEPRQYSYMLYPDKELPLFEEKNCVTKSMTAGLESLLERSDGKILSRDRNGIFHFHADFRNARVMHEKIAGLPPQMRPDGAEQEILDRLYEATFRHRSFTGRSGTFYAYEGLGSIYWHMVAKLLLAAQEYAVSTAEQAFREDATEKIGTARALALAYYDIKKGCGCSKTPELYGAFPSDPYSHTPSGQGAKQPGMTGQVKEEILTRWGELGVMIQDGKAAFRPHILRKEEFSAEGTLSFSWCGTKVTYIIGSENKIRIIKEGKTIAVQPGEELTGAQTKRLFSRSGLISEIEVTTTLKENLI